MVVIGGTGVPTMKLVARVLILALLLWSANALATEAYAEARARMLAAYQAQDYPAMVVAARAAFAARPGRPGSRFNLALAHALNGEPEVALEHLGWLLHDGVDFGVAGMDEFTAVRELPEWPEFEAQLKVLHEPVGDAEVVLTIDDGDFVPEGVAVESDGDIYLGSIHKGLLVRGDEVLSNRQGHWSVFGMRFHADGTLWFASAAVPQLDGVEEDRGKTGLFQIDPDTGRLLRAAILPQVADEQVLGDLIIHGDLIYTTDSLTGGVYEYDIAADKFTTLVEPGVLRSPQGLVLNEAGDMLYVADYASGLYYIDLERAEAKKLLVTANATDHGIDGLYRHGDELVAIQNGVRPHRVVAFQLEHSGFMATRSRTVAANLPQFDEPTLGTVHGDDFYFVANSHWNRFDQDNDLPDGLTGPIVLKVRLSHE